MTDNDQEILKQLRKKKVSSKDLINLSSEELDNLMLNNDTEEEEENEEEDY